MTGKCVFLSFLRFVPFCSGSLCFAFGIYLFFFIFFDNYAENALVTYAAGFNVCRHSKSCVRWLVALISHIWRGPCQLFLSHASRSCHYGRFFLSHIRHNWYACHIFSAFQPLGRHRFMASPLLPPPPPTFYFCRLWTFSMPFNFLLCSLALSLNPYHRNTLQFEFRI